VRGNDSDPCTVALPCRSFTVAIPATNPGGEVIALDSAGYGPFTVNYALTISGAPGVHAAITAMSTDAIDIFGSAGDQVTLRNLVLIGSVTAGGIDGVHVFGSADARVINCTIRGFTLGVEANSGHVTVDHSTIVDSQSWGIILSSVGMNPVSANIIDTLLDGTGAGGVLVLGGATAMVRGTTVTRVTTGVTADSTFGTGALAATATLESCTFSYGFYGVKADAAGGNNTAKIYLAQDEVSYNTTGAFIQGNGQIYTFGNNRFTENGSDGGALTPFALK
jgi:hypothetical protein